MLGYYWPSVLALILSSCHPNFVAPLISGIEAFLVESPGQPAHWRLYASASLDDTLDQMGLKIDSLME